MTNCIIARIEKRYGGLCVLAGTQSSNEALAVIASALLLQMASRISSGVKLVIRNTETESVLAAFGEFNETDICRLKALSAQLSRVHRSAKYVDYRQAERDCEILAGKLKARYSESELGGFTVYPVPRGGCIVQGMLSYALDVRIPRVRESGSESSTILVVDDCAISGLRLGEVLARFPGHKIIFATLYSHPDLRDAICRRESQVIDFVSANDLTDLAPELYGDGCKEWKTNWAERYGSTAYWIGQPEYLCFAWNEPESACWNPFSREIEPGWFLVPPERCLKHRSRSWLNAGTAPSDLQIIPEFPGPIRPLENVLYAQMDDNSIAITSAPNEDCFLLEGTAADMWTALLTNGSKKAASAALANLYDISPEQLEGDLGRFVDQLKSQALIADACTAG